MKVLVACEEPRKDFSGRGKGNVRTMGVKNENRTGNYG